MSRNRDLNNQNQYYAKNNHHQSRYGDDALSGQPRGLNPQSCPQSIRNPSALRISPHQNQQSQLSVQVHKDRLQTPPSNKDYDYGAWYRERKETAASEEKKTTKAVKRMIRDVESLKPEVDSLINILQEFFLGDDNDDDVEEEDEKDYTSDFNNKDQNEVTARRCKDEKLEMASIKSKVLMTGYYTLSSRKGSTIQPQLDENNYNNKEDSALLPDCIECTVTISKGAASLDPIPQEDVIGEEIPIEGGNNNNPKYINRHSEYVPIGALSASLGQTNLNPSEERTEEIRPLSWSSSEEAAATETGPVKPETRCRRPHRGSRFKQRVRSRYHRMESRLHRSETKL